MRVEGNVVYEATNCPACGAEISQAAEHFIDGDPLGFKFRYKCTCGETWVESPGLLGTPVTSKLQTPEETAALNKVAKGAERITLDEFKRRCSSKDGV